MVDINIDMQLKDKYFQCLLGPLIMSGFCCILRCAIWLFPFLFPISTEFHCVIYENKWSRKLNSVSNSRKIVSRLKKKKKVMYTTQTWTSDY